MPKMRYGLEWADEYDDLAIEFYCIQKGGSWKNRAGEEIGAGLYHHYKEIMRLLWPKDDEHRWADLFLRTYLENKIIGVMGPQNSNKTYMGAKMALIDYWAFPAHTLIMVSSTDIRGLELRVWGTIKDLYNRAKERHPELAGNVLESYHTITTDKLKKNDEDDTPARVLKRGIICIPCLAGGRYVGLGKWIGAKQKRVRLIADECQLMGTSFLDAISNLGGNLDFKAVFLGNPIDPMDPLGRACEPQGGWHTIGEPTKTTVWTSRFMNGVCINFVGSDSPNFDFPADKPPRYPYMIHQRRLDEIAAFWGKDSQQYYSQGIGVMKEGMLNRRVITRQMCYEGRALEKATWKDTQRTRIYALDAAYGGVGGDRCIGGWGEFGESEDGVSIIRINKPKTLPVSIKNPTSPENQIAVYMKNDMDSNSIPYQNGFYDSTGRGTLGSELVKVFGQTIPVPVEFGGKPTTRPVRHDLYITDDDGERRHKTCREHYLDFVSELWFSVAYIIQCGQMRELPEEVMLEGCMKEFGTAAGNKLFVESKHPDKPEERARLLMTHSPDLFDWLVCLCEGARQRGFIIRKLGNVLVEPGDDWEDDSSEEFDQMLQESLLIHN